METDFPSCAKPVALFKVMPRYVAAIDQGTTSTRCMLFGRDGPASIEQLEHEQIFPRPGWVEHDAEEIWLRTRQVVRGAIERAGAKPDDIAAIGIANQRETTVAWSRATGRPFGRAIVWQDTRTRDLCDRLEAQGGADRFRPTTGLPLATYFSGPKMRWMLDHDALAASAAARGELLCGTIDAWLVWNLTGGPRGGVHATDVTNASRTLLMDLHTLRWDDELLRDLGIPPAILPRKIGRAHV